MMAAATVSTTAAIATSVYGATVLGLFGVSALYHRRWWASLRVRAWMKRQGWRIEPTMQLDNFDLIINLVSLGMGISFVPIRALALWIHEITT